MIKRQIGSSVFILGLAYFMLGAAPLRKEKIKKIKYTSSVSLKIPEPSDMAVSPKGNTFYVISDNAIVFEIDQTGAVLREVTPVKGIDFEGVWSDEKHVYTVDETTRKIHLLNHEKLSLDKTLNFTYSGGRNKGMESICYNKSKGVFVLISESGPSTIFETDSNFVQLNEVEWTQSRDVSAATYYNNHVWILSDEDMTVFKCNPQTYEVVDKWIINVLNPEGILFDKDGRMVIISDDLERMYFFNNPEL